MTTINRLKALLAEKFRVFMKFKKWLQILIEIFKKVYLKKIILSNK